MAIEFICGDCGGDGSRCDCNKGKPRPREYWDDEYRIKKEIRDNRIKCYKETGVWLP